MIQFWVDIRSTFVIIAKITEKKGYNNEIMALIRTKTNKFQNELKWIEIGILNTNAQAFV